MEKPDERDPDPPDEPGEPTGDLADGGAELEESLEPNEDGTLPVGG